jgi:hypothetical protein
MVLFNTPFERSPAMASHLSMEERKRISDLWEADYSRGHIARVYANPDSVPKLINPTAEGNEFRLAASTLIGKTYRLEYKNSLSESNWTPLSAIDGDGRLKTLLDQTATVPQRFYRVRVE